MLFALYYLFISLGSTALIDYDEAIYAKVARNIKESGDFLTLYWNTSNPWFEKPPLYMWLTSLTLRLSNYYYTAWAIRFWSALFGLLTTFVVFKWAKNQFGYFSAFISAISLVTTVHFLYYSRIGMLDVTVTFFITLALYFYYFGKGRVRNLLIAGALIGFGVMTKAIIGLLPLIIIGVYELALIFNKEKKISQSIKEFVTMFLGIFVIAGPWHLYMFFMHGTDFWNSYFVHQIFKRGTTGEQDKVAPFWWYVTVIKVSMRFWYIILIPTLTYFALQFIQSFKKIKISKSYLFLIIWVLTVFSFFSFSQTKLIWYIIPLYPALSIMIGAFVSLVINKKISYLLLGILTWISVILLGISLIPSSLNLFQNLLLGLLLIVIGGLASLIVTFVYSNNIFHKRYFKYFALYIVLIIGFYNIYLVRDRVWTEDFNKFKLVLIHTANYKVLDIDKLYYVEMPDPAVGFYSFKDIKGAGSTDLYKIYSNLPFSEKMLILAESGSDKEFLDNKVDVTRLNKEDNYYLYQVQSKREKIQGEINKASDLLRYLMLEIQASIRSQGYATQEQLQDKLMFENTIEEKTKTLNILLEEEKLDLIKKEERNKLD